MCHSLWTLQRPRWIHGPAVSSAGTTTPESTQASSCGARPRGVRLRQHSVAACRFGGRISKRCARQASACFRIRLERCGSVLSSLQPCPVTCWSWRRRVLPSTNGCALRRAERQPHLLPCGSDCSPSVFDFRRLRGPRPAPSLPLSPPPRRKAHASTTPTRTVHWAPAPGPAVAAHDAHASGL